MADPQSTHTRPDRHGGVGRTPTGALAEFGTVVSVDAQNYAYTVRTMGGRPLPAMPRKRSSPSDVSILPVGCTVVVRYDLGAPYIDGVLDMPASRPLDDGIPTTGIDSPSTGPAQGNFRANGEPSDLLPGDHVLSNASGARVGVLEGGIALLRAGGLSQIRAHILKDLVEIISRNYRHITDMGELKIENTDGRVNLSFRGATDQESEAGANEQNWTIRLDLGAVGDLFNFELTTPQGQLLFRMHVDSDGRCTIFGLDGVVLQSGARTGQGAVTEQGGDASSIVRGAQNTTVDGDVTEVFGANHNATVMANRVASVGNDDVTAAARDWGVSAGRDVSLTAAKAMTTQVLDGDSVTKVGQPTKPKGRYQVETLRGRILLKSLQGGDIELDTATGTFKAKARKATINTQGNDSCILGGDSLVAHATRFEQLETCLRAMMACFDAHTQTTASGGLASPPTVSMTATCSPLIAPCKSLKVGVGG